MSTDLPYLSATQARKMFEARELSPVELMRAVIERTEKIEPVVNAFTERIFDDALIQAQHAENRFAGKDGLAPRPLEGIPVATKEKHAIANRSLTEGSLVNIGRIAPENAPVIDRILEAGGIIHARTATPEFSLAYFTHSRLWGITRNPWHPEFTPGGSSGGSAASLAAGTSLLATGSDIAGSTRVPAAFTGTVGFKAPYGRIAGVAPLALDHYRGDGPLARTIDDCITFTNVLTGQDPRDHASLRDTPELPHSYEAVTGMRIALCLTLGDYEVHTEIQANTRAVASTLAEAGAVVEEIELPWTQADIRVALGGHLPAIFGEIVQEIARDHRDELSPYTVEFAERMAVSREQFSYLDGLRAEARMQRILAEAMAGFDALVCPTTTVPGLPADVALDPDIYGVAMTSPFNICNRCPVLNVPSGRSSWGLPTGLQIVGHPYDDATVFRVGKVLEELRPWPVMNTATEAHRPPL
jgi:aspartyl-tRNA(Asn)/glutamyl-tRNA(Gln) amidotransferase subunit A